jgi:hypothetical protein
MRRRDYWRAKHEKREADAGWRIYQETRAEAGREGEAKQDADEAQPGQQVPGLLGKGQGQYESHCPYCKTGSGRYFHIINCKSNPNRLTSK